jgi:hypothetical protein
MSEQTLNNRRYLIGFSVTGAIVTILFFAFINYSTGVRFPWFLFPSYAVIWWPLATLFAGRHSAKVLSLFGSAATITLLVVTNYITSWSYPWFLYASFAVIWWPLGVFFGARHRKVFSIAGTIVLILFFMITNYMNSPAYIWFYYPVFAVIWWPLSVFLAGPRTAKAYSIIGALLLLAFLAGDNLLHAPFCPWVLFTVYPVLMWPVCVLLGRRASSVAAAVLCGAAGIACYAALNLIVFKGFPWVIFPAYALLWWPLATLFAKRGHLTRFALAGAALSILFFITINALTSPRVIWAIYPIYALIWWPLAILFAKRGHLMRFSIAGAALSILFFITTNALTTPHVIWAVYPIFALIWWPLAVYYFVYRRKRVIQ